MKILGLAFCFGGSVPLLTLSFPPIAPSCSAVLQSLKLLPVVGLPMCPGGWNCLDLRSPLCWIGDLRQVPCLPYTRSPTNNVGMDGAFTQAMRAEFIITRLEQSLALQKHRVREAGNGLRPLSYALRARDPTPDTISPAPQPQPPVSGQECGRSCVMPAVGLELQRKGHLAAKRSLF